MVQYKIYHKQQHSCSYYGHYHNHLQTTYNLDNLEIKYVARSCNSAAKRTKTFFFPPRDTKLTRIDFDDDDDDDDTCP